MSQACNSNSRQVRPDVQPGTEVRLSLYICIYIVYIYISRCVALPCFHVACSVGLLLARRFGPNPRYAHVALRCGKPVEDYLHHATLLHTVPVMLYTAPVNAPLIRFLACGSCGDDDWCYTNPPKAGNVSSSFSPTLVSVPCFEKTNSNLHGSVRFWKLVNPLQLRLAEITEMIHAASLFHDDVIDEADTRRGVPSVNKVFGNKLAILAGKSEWRGFA